MTRRTYIQAAVWCILVSWNKLHRKSGFFGHRLKLKKCLLHNMWENQPDVAVKVYVQTHSESVLVIEQRLIRYNDVMKSCKWQLWENPGHHLERIFILSLSTLSNNRRHAVVQIWPGCWGLTHMLHKIIRILWLYNQRLSIHTAEVSLSNTLNDHQLRGCRALWPSCSKTTWEQQSPSDRSKSEWKSARVACKWTKRRMRGSIIDQMSMLTKQHGSASLVFLLVAFTDNWMTATSVK